VQGGDKVGIVGRTGSGKSSLALSFFRFIEPTSGNISIDGLDINSLALDDLRSRLTIVAQEAALFKGSLRFNLDPFGQHSDRDVWDALRRVQMAAPGVSGITPKPTPGPSRAASPAPSESEASTAAAEETERYVVKSLEMEVTEGGKNFSAGASLSLSLFPFLPSFLPFSLPFSLSFPALRRLADLLYLRARRSAPAARPRARHPQAQVVEHPHTRRVDGEPRPRDRRAHPADDPRRDGRRDHPVYRSCVTFLLALHPSLLPSFVPTPPSSPIECPPRCCTC